MPKKSKASKPAVKKSVRKKQVKRFKFLHVLIPSLFVSAIGLFFAFQMAGVQRAQRVRPLPVVAKSHKPVCPGPIGKDFARCHAQVVTDASGMPQVATGPAGYGPLQFHTAYNLPTGSASNPILAIVDAYDDPNAYSDLTTYSNQYGIPALPQCAGSIAQSSVPCFAKVNQNGATAYPSFDSGWALEISLDIEAAHAICQNCRLLLVEASSNSFGNLLTAENQVLSQGATVVSNSWSGNEFSGETSYDSYFNHPGTVFAFPSGDSGYSGGTQYPSASQYTISVGGTTLQLNSDNTYYNETVWSGTGSGCSLYETKPGWQHDTGCSKRTLNDVSADADPSTGAAVYDSAGYNGQYGWFEVGGTSLATPLVAATYALAGVTPNVYEASIPYGHTQNLHDITLGSSGTCSPLYLCTAGTGYDGPSGLGTPNGDSAFTGVSTTPTPTSSLSPTPTSSPTLTSSSTPTPTPKLHGHGKKPHR